jgi:hypothetical protein
MSFVLLAVACSFRSLSLEEKMSAHRNLRCASTNDGHPVKSNVTGGYTTMGGGVTGYGLYGKRAKLISWIGHHVEEGNGAPSLFVTL